MRLNDWMSIQRGEMKWSDFNETRGGDVMWCAVMCCFDVMCFDVMWRDLAWCDVSKGILRGAIALIIYAYNPTPWHHITSHQSHQSIINHHSSIINQTINQTINHRSYLPNSLMDGSSWRFPLRTKAVVWVFGKIRCINTYPVNTTSSWCCGGDGKVIVVVILL